MEFPLNALCMKMEIPILKFPIITTMTHHTQLYILNYHMRCFSTSQQTVLKHN